MFAKKFTHKKGLYTAMHNVKSFCMQKKGAVKKRAIKKDCNHP